MSIFKIIVFNLIILLSVINLNAQCDKSLTEKAITESGDSALFLKSFKAKLKKGKLNRPERVAKYLITLKYNTSYRFNVLNDKKSEGEVILQLFKRDEFQNSTYDFKNGKDIKSFNFTCIESGKYEILMSFLDRKAGCAVGIMSMIMNDSTEIDKKYVKETLYLGIKNPLYISYEDKPGNNISVNSSQGNIFGNNNKYMIELEETGFVIINAQVTDSIGTVTEKISIAFKVRKMPVPIIEINGITEGEISKENLINSSGLALNHLKLSTDDYEIISFSVVKDLSDTIEMESYFDEFSDTQKKFFKELRPESSFYLTNIKVKFPDGKVYELNSHKFTIQKANF